MKIGEYFVQNNYITQKELNEALELQTHEKSLRLGEVIVKMGVISKEALNKYVANFLNDSNKAIQKETEKWLSQEEVDEQFAKYGNKKNGNLEI